MAKKISYEPGDKLWHKKYKEYWEIISRHYMPKKDETDFSYIYYFKGCLIPGSLFEYFFE